ncbi:MAG TPA: hypothetical protein VFJ43_16840, partial [Bacteroidia bacterium]|nr:hypothetical protein [Bacteroidia bacterium]
KKMEEDTIIFDGHKKTQNELEEGLRQKTEDFQKQNATFTEILKFVESKKGFFDERLKYLDELIGKEAAAQMFKTFDARKKELDKPVKRWENIVFVTSGATLILIIGIFTNFFGLLGTTSVTVNWEYLLISSIKTVPAIILLYFTIRQYVKERTYQEEYAFRSAVALTVLAYANLLSSDSDKKSNKDAMIMESVLRIYKSPTAIREKQGSIFSFRTKPLNETMKTMTDLVQKLNDTIAKK